MSLLKKKKKPFVNMRIKAPSEIHSGIVAHQGLMRKNSEYEIPLEEAAIDLIKRGMQTIPSY